jgi:phosphocarrier protein
MKEFSYTIKDPIGIHARPAGELVKKFHEFSSVVTILHGNDSCDGKKLIALMKLRVKHGEDITIKVEGADEEKAIGEIKLFVNDIL